MYYYKTNKGVVYPIYEIISFQDFFLRTYFIKIDNKMNIGLLIYFIECSMSNNNITIDLYDEYNSILRLHDVKVEIDEELGRIMLKSSYTQCYFDNY